MKGLDRDDSAQIRSLSSEDAATYLIEKYADAYPVCITHRSWEKPDQNRLAKKFLGKLPHATGRAYDDFLSFMSIDAFLKVVEEQLAEMDRSRIDLLTYYLAPSLSHAAKTERQRMAVEKFITDLKN